MRLAKSLAVCALLSLLSVVAPKANAQSSTNSITLQAKLDGVSGPRVNLTVKFFDAPTGGTQVGTTITLNGVPLVGDIVSVPVSPVDATVFNGETRYMEIATSGTILSPRTLVASVPYAIIALGTPSDSVLSCRRINASADVAGAVQNLTVASEFSNRLNVEGANFTFADSGIPVGTYGLAVNYKTAGGAFDIIRAYSNGVNQSVPIFSVKDSGQTTVKKLVVDSDGDPTISAPVLDVHGTTQTRILTITGADVAEPFDVARSDADTEPKSGMVVSIDPANPGKLMLSKTSYDKKVAGAISGANGLSVGMVLGKDNADPMVRGDLPVAMSGRVYVYCDASFGAILPGDRLTTSSTLGHAMKVGDESRAGGAVIGKAMTGLKDGKGLVLVLVNLQ